MAEQFTIPTPGDIIAGKYLIQKELGRGSYGVVFRARHLGVERDVALKTLLPQAFLQTDIVERFQREAAMVSRLKHPNIVTLYDFGESEGVLYMAMEFIEGLQISSIIKREAPLDKERAVGLIKQVLAALKAAHKKGIVHRDLKPENIIVCDSEDQKGVVKVLDFGIAKMTESDEQLGALKTLTIQGYVLGTPHYMSPETITGDEVDNRADLYAVGLLLYEMLTGKHPFNAPKPSAVLLKHLSEPIPPLPDAKLENSHIGYAIRKALSKQREDRMADATTFIEILDGHHNLPSTMIWRSPALMAAAVSVAILLTMGVFFIAHQLDEGTPKAEAVTPADVGIQLSAAVSVGDSGSRSGPKVSSAAEKSAQVSNSGATPEPQTPKVRKREVKAKPVIPRAEVKAKAVAPKAEANTTVLNFSSEPVGAQVIVNGRPAGTTPCRAVVQGKDPVKVLVKKIGYKGRSMSVNPSGKSKNINVKLKPGRIKLSP